MKTPYLNKCEKAGCKFYFTPHGEKIFEGPHHHGLTFGDIEEAWKEIDNLRKLTPYPVKSLRPEEVLGHE